MHTKSLFSVCLICSTSFTIYHSSNDKNVLFCPSFLLDRAPGIYACTTQISHYPPSFLVVDWSLIQLNFLPLPWTCRSVIVSMPCKSTGIKLSLGSFLLEMLRFCASRVACDSLTAWEGVLKGRRGCMELRIPSWRASSSQAAPLLFTHSSLCISLVFLKKLKDGKTHLNCINKVLLSYLMFFQVKKTMMNACMLIYVS